MTEGPKKWFHDSISPHFQQLHSVNAVVYSGTTAFQSVEVLDLGSFGQCLMLDGKLQSSERDEFFYHEALVHPPMLAHPNPRYIFIAGGGEGAALREVLRHPTVEKVVMVDVDSEVVALCRQYFPALSQGAFDDPRARLVAADARRYLAETSERYDVIICDLPDPVAGSPAALLYTREFYDLVRGRLAPGGSLGVQSGAAFWGEHQTFATIRRTIGSVFPQVIPYQVNVPSFGGNWGFSLALLGPLPSVEEFQRRLQARGLSRLRAYDGVAHLGFFALPRCLREALEERGPVITDQNLLTVY